MRDAGTRDRVVFHRGGNPGPVAYLVYAPARRSGLFVVANSQLGIGVIRELVPLWAAGAGVRPPTIF